jgi:hypothetical protein
MNVICSAGKGELPISECLACALSSGRPPCGYDYALLKSMFASDQKSDRAKEIHVTDLTGCIRKAWYTKVDPTPEYVHEKLTRWMGSHMHGIVEGSDTYLDSELPLSADGIVGTSDVVYKDGRVLDFKFTRWMYLDKLPYGSHALQVNVYGWMLRQMGRPVRRLQIQYIDASGPTKCRSCKVPVRMTNGALVCPKCMALLRNAHLGAYLIDVPVLSDSEVLEAIQERKETLENAIALGLAPEREPGFLCGYCASYERCQPDLRQSEGG